MMQFRFLFRAAVLFPILFAAARSDEAAGKIPNSLVLCGLAAAVPAAVFFPLVPEPEELCYGAGLLLLLLLLRRRHLIGGGDIKLFFMILCFYPCRAGLLILCGSFVFAAAAGIWGFLQYRYRRVPMGACVLLSAFSVLAYPGGML